MEITNSLPNVDELFLSESEYEPYNYKDFYMVSQYDIGENDIRHIANNMSYEQIKQMRIKGDISFSTELHKRIFYDMYELKNQTINNPDCDIDTVNFIQVIVDKYNCCKYANINKWCEIISHFGVRVH